MSDSLTRLLSEVVSAREYLGVTCAWLFIRPWMRLARANEGSGVFVEVANGCQDGAEIDAGFVDDGT